MPIIKHRNRTSRRVTEAPEKLEYEELQEAIFKHAVATIGVIPILEIVEELGDELHDYYPYLEGMDDVKVPKVNYKGLSAPFKRISKDLQDTPGFESKSSDIKHAQRKIILNIQKETTKFPNEYSKELMQAESRIIDAEREYDDEATELINSCVIYYLLKLVSQLADSMDESSLSSKASKSMKDTGKMVEIILLATYQNYLQVSGVSSSEVKSLLKEAAKIGKREVEYVVTGGIRQFASDVYGYPGSRLFDMSDYISNNLDF